LTDSLISGVPFEPKQVPMLDVVRDNGELRDALLARIGSVVDSGRFLHGPDVREAEERIAALSGTAYGISCASGSDALLLSLMASCVGLGDEVIIPSFTFFATASAVSRLGARAVFVDIDPLTFNLDPQLVEDAITSRTKAIIPVHLFGQCAAMDQFCELGSHYSISIIEDAAQAIGASYQDRMAGSWGDVGCFSFYPTKNLGGCGDGGMMTTRDEDWAERLRLLAAHGMSPRYFHKVVGINSRLDSIQAAAVNVKLSRLEQWTAQRQAHAGRYAQLFADVGLQEVLTLPTESEGCRHVWNQYTIRVPETRRDALRAYLTGKGVGSEVYYPCPLHLQECFQEMGFGAGSLPESERAAQEVLSLPIFPGLTVDEQQVVVGRIAEFYGARQANAA
jgi:dTDP-4-amino-4,6-dideoxygalactose transaminase